MSQLQNDTLKAIGSLGWCGFASALENQYKNPSLYLGLSFEERLEECLSAQKDFIERRRIANALKRAKLNGHLDVQQIEPGETRGLSSSVWRELVKCHFVEQPFNILLLGYTGTGKTVIACALARQAVKLGYTAVYYRMSDLCCELETKDNAARERFIKNLNRFSILILDDFGLEPLKTDISARLLDLLDGRANKKPVILAGQIKAKTIKTVLGGGTIADAFYDRIMNPSITVELTGESWRNRLKAEIGTNDK